MTTSTHYWLRALLYSVSGLAMLSGLTMLVKERLRERLENGKIGGGWMRSFLVITGERVTRQAAKVMAFALGLLLGYAVRDHQFNANRYTYADVAVLERHDDKHFTLQPARMAPWEFASCTPLDWMPQQRMRLLTFQRRAGCHDAAERGSYEFYTVHGKRVTYPEEIANAD